jgi:hypothetical protein
MVKYFYFTLILIFSLVVQLNTQDEVSVTDLTITAITRLLTDTIFTIQEKISDPCFTNLNIVINDELNLYTNKFLRDSAKNLNDVGNYKSCFSTSYKLKNNTSTGTIQDNLTYVVFNVENNDMNNIEELADVRYEAYNFLLGTCLIKGCTKMDLKNVFITMNQKLNIFDGLKDQNIEVLDIKEGEVEFTLSTFVRLSPVLFLIIMIIFSLSPKVVWFVFRCCFRKKKCEDSHRQEKLKKLSDYWKLEYKNTLTDKCRLTCLQRCFDMTENSNILMTNELKDSGVNIINGLRAFAIILTNVGLVFRVLYTSPIKIFCIHAFKQMVASYSFSIILFGRRFGPALLYSFSGYILIYKLISYLDDKVEELEDKTKIECI